MVKVVAKTFTDENGHKKVESFDSMLRRFKKKVATEGLIQEMKSKEYYITRTQKRRLEKQAATRRYRRNEAKRRAKEEMFELHRNSRNY